MEHTVKTKKKSKNFYKICFFAKKFKTQKGLLFLFKKTLTYTKQEL